MADSPSLIQEELSSRRWPEVPREERRPLVQELARLRLEERSRGQMATTLRLRRGTISSLLSKYDLGKTHWRESAGRILKGEFLPPSRHQDPAFGHRGRLFDPLDYNEFVVEELQNSSSGKSFELEFPLPGGRIRIWVAKVFCDVQLVSGGRYWIRYTSWHCSLAQVTMPGLNFTEGDEHEGRRTR